MSTLKLAPFYEKIGNTINVCLTDIDNTGGLSESPAMQYLYDSIDGFFVVAYAIIEAMKENDPDLDYSIFRTIEILTQDIQGRTPENKALMRWVKDEMFSEDVSAGRIRQKRSAAVSGASNWIQVKLGIEPEIEETAEFTAKVKVLQILSIPIIGLIAETCNFLALRSQNELKDLTLVQNMLMVVAELRALANTRATIKDILMLQIRRGITDNFISAGRDKKVVNDAISVIVEQYQKFPDAELRKTIEDTLGTKNQMLTYLTVYQEQT